MDKQLLLADIQEQVKIITSHSVGYAGDDTMMKGGLLEIVVGQSAVRVDAELWNSWTGHRLLNGEEYHGPVYHLDEGKGNPYRGVRLCNCNKCQEHVAPFDLKLAN